jgi:hypothetical protein
VTDDSGDAKLANDSGGVGPADPGSGETAPSGSGAAETSPADAGTTDSGPVEPDGPAEPEGPDGSDGPDAGAASFAPAEQPSEGEPSEGKPSEERSSERQPSDGGRSTEERRRVSRAYYASDASLSPRETGAFPSQPPRYTREGKKGRKRGLAAIAVAAAAVIVVGLVVAIKVIPGENPVGFQPTAGSAGGDAEQLTNAFLQAWGSGDIAKAAGYTDDPAAAKAALTAYGTDLHLRKLTGAASSVTMATRPKAAAGSKPTSGPAASDELETVSFQLNSTVAASASATAVSGTWTYHSSLVAYQEPGGTGWFVEWQPSVVAPNLTASQHLATVTTSPQVISVTDSSGNQLSSYNDPGLTGIATLLQKQAPVGKGKDGLNVQIENAKNKAVPNSQAVVVAAQNIGDLATTINPSAEKAALSAVKEKPNSAMVVIQPSSGDILAIANNVGQNDFALTARVAPGSDFKIVTSTALINAGDVTANSSVACPASYSVGGITIHNDQGESEPSGTPFSYDFAQSCNNAFTQWWQQLSASSGRDKLAQTAEQYYGLTKSWNIGLGSSDATSYFDMPKNEPNSGLAEEAFGQGLLEGDPLAMASVAATVENGSFKQPILVPGTKQITATPLPSSTKSQLWEMMRDVVTEGTAAGAGFGSGVYGKTGTADVSNSSNPNAWFVAFEPSKDVAAATVVLNGGYGATAAAPEVKAVLNGYKG